MKLIVGLGNPGDQYVMTRHNVGFMAVDMIARQKGFSAWTEKFKALYAKKDDVILLKPQTFMNLSGQAVQACMTFFKIPLEDIWVIHDEIELPLGEIKVKTGGSAKGHNGLRSIDQCIGQNYHRICCGIGRPNHPNIADYVLSNFAKSELEHLAIELQTVADLFFLAKTS